MERGSQAQSAQGLVSPEAKEQVGSRNRGPEPAATPGLRARVVLNSSLPDPGY